MKISIIGTGYVGLVQGVVLADFGFNIICMDKDEKRIADIKKGIIPIYEPGLAELLEKNTKADRIRFTADIVECIKKTDVLFIAVNTPSNEDGSADLTHVLKVAEEIGKHIDSYKVIVNKSTVPVGTGRLVREKIASQLEKRGENIDFDIVSNPEFLREGKAIGDSLRPDRVIIGTKSERACQIMKDIYNVLYLLKTPFIFTDIETAELIKYASNAFLAVKISFINEMALLAEKVGADVQQIASAMGMDGRISPKFLHPGPGFGGSCFPKDTSALVQSAKECNEEFLVVEAAIKANKKQYKKMVEKIEKKMNGLNGKTIGILGLSFKPETDDIREAPALFIINDLIRKGAEIKAFCPAGMTNTKKNTKNLKYNIQFTKDEYFCLTDCDAAVLITEWNQFRGLDLQRIKKSMNGDLFFDLRNVFTKNKNIRKLFKYYPVGLK